MVMRLPEIGFLDGGRVTQRGLPGVCLTVTSLRDQRHFAEVCALLSAILVIDVQWILGR